jgi:DNA-directed RNA polymerase specialized sigma24 family protein
MNKDWVLSQELFDALLNWLDPDREQAGHRYEEIRRRLIKIFSCRGCHKPEDLTDETINRVAGKLKDIEGKFSGPPARYFYGVANKVHLEYLRERQVRPSTSPPANSERIEAEYRCLEHCMGLLSAENRQLVLKYYQGDKQEKIEQRKMLAAELGIAANALRIRAFRIRNSLLGCVQDCLAQSSETS